MIFSEIYNLYYNTVAKILAAAVDHPLEKNELRSIIEQSAFGESILSIVPALEEERWQLLHSDGTTAMTVLPTLPLTLLQKRWLKAISLDPRIRLFSDELPELDDVQPLFTPADYCIFDRYTDGDSYEDAAYVDRFRMILSAIRDRRQLKIAALNRSGRVLHLSVLPEYLEYSEKDDKFRLISFGSVINLARILSCQFSETSFDVERSRPATGRPRTVELELTDERNALERVLLHFAHHQKEVERLENGNYRILIHYDKDDETEILIRILSFGPLVRVTAPQNFVNLIKTRLSMQKSCEQ